MFKVNTRNTRTKCETCLKLTIKRPERLFENFILCGAGTCNLVSHARKLSQKNSRTSV